MKTLYLVRHAKSSWTESGLGDFERPLNKRGKHDAPMMGERLLKRGVKIDHIVSSPARRARKTLKAISEKMGWPEENIFFEDRIYEAGESTLLDIVSGFDDEFDSAMMVGHNPGFTMLAESLSGQNFGNIPTCGVVCLNFDVDSWKAAVRGLGTVVFYDYPKNIED